MTTAILGGAIAGIAGAFLALMGVLLTSRWRIAEENILKQRAEWRDKVRSLVAQAVNADTPAEARSVWAELALRMNPIEDLDKDDAELVALARSLEWPENRNDAVRDRLVALAAHILKHDWTRAKWEASGRVWDAEPAQTLAGASSAPEVASALRRIWCDRNGPPDDLS
jgi:hypothetical protein